jgi:hypothetical protein
MNAQQTLLNKMSMKGRNAPNSTFLASSSLPLLLVGVMVKAT